MSEKDPGLPVPNAEALRKPYLTIPAIIRPDNDKSAPNSGEEYNPSLERRESWLATPSHTWEADVISQQDMEVLREEPDEFSSQ